MHLHGQITGIGKVTPDGQTYYRELERPIKNTIVKAGLNEFMTHDGTLNTLYSGNSPEEPLNCFEYAGYGTSSSPTDFATTIGLVALEGTPSNTHYPNNTSSAWPFRGTTRGEAYPVVKFRQTYYMDASVNGCTVREIGLYKYYSGGFHMFARVVLPFSYVLNAGERLIATYELVIDFDGAIKTTVNVNGFKDYQGNALDIQTKSIIECGNPGSTNGCYIDFNGSFQQSSSSYANKTFIYGPQIGTNNRTDRNLIYLDSGFSFPSDWSNVSYFKYDNSASKPIVTIDNYVQDSFKRQHHVYCPQFWPSMTLESEFKDIAAIAYGFCCVRFCKYDSESGTYPGRVWRKYANKSAYLTFEHKVSTADSIAWEQNQSP